MAQTMVDLDRKIARSAGLPAFLQRRIQFKEASAEDKPTIVSYTTATSSLPKAKSVFDPSCLLMEWPNICRVGGGLRNLGNTCFLNATLQCLYYTIPLNLYLHSEEHGKLCRDKGEHCMICELGRTFKNMANMGSCTPSGIASRLRGIARHFKPGRQEDAHEFLRYFVESLQKTPSGTSASACISGIFGGKLRSVITCGNCGHRSITTDPFLDLSLDIKVSDTIASTIAHYCKREILSKGNRYRCESCSELSEASKQMLLEHLPPILTLHLKRFSSTHHFQPTIAKLHKHVEFAPEMDISPYTTAPEDSARYQLYAILVHDGHSTHSGHYYSFIRAPNRLWYCMNDDSVTQVSQTTVLRQKAYILFYQREPNTPKEQSADEDNEGIINVVNVDEVSSEVSSIAKSSSMWHLSPNTSEIVGKKTNKRKHSSNCPVSNAKLKWNISKCD